MHNEKKMVLTFLSLISLVGVSCGRDPKNYKCNALGLGVQTDVTFDQCEAFKSEAARTLVAFESEVGWSSQSVLDAWYGIEVEVMSPMDAPASGAWQFNGTWVNGLTTCPKGLVQVDQADF